MPDQTRAQQIGLGLQAFGAGIQGNLPQFQAAQNQRAQLQAQQQEQQRLQQERQRQQEEQRRQQVGKFSASIAKQALTLAESDQWDRVVELGINAVEQFQQMGLDASDVQQMLQLGIAAKNGSDEGGKLLIERLKTEVDLGEAFGFLEKPEGLEGFTLGKGGQRFDPEGVLIAENIPEEVAKAEGFTNITRLDSGEFVGLKDDKIQLIPTEEATEEALVIKPEEEDISPAERKVSSFALRTQDAGTIIDGLEEKFSGRLAGVGGVFPRITQSADRKRFEDASRDFIAANLRLESGAAIQPSEFEDARARYIPVAGDDADVLAQKKRVRDTIIQGLILEAGGGFTELQEVLTPQSVIINDQEFEVGQIVENDQGQRGRIEADGSITIL